MPVSFREVIVRARRLVAHADFFMLHNSISYPLKKINRKSPVFQKKLHNAPPRGKLNAAFCRLELWWYSGYYSPGLSVYGGVVQMVQKCDEKFAILTS